MTASASPQTPITPETTKADVEAVHSDLASANSQLSPGAGKSLALPPRGNQEKFGGAAACWGIGPEVQHRPCGRAGGRSSVRLPAPSTSPVATWRPCLAGKGFSHILTQHVAAMKRRQVGPSHPDNVHGTADGVLRAENRPLGRDANVAPGRRASCCAPQISYFNCLPV